MKNSGGRGYEKYPPHLQKNHPKTSQIRGGGVRAIPLKIQGSIRNTPRNTYKNTKKKKVPKKKKKGPSSWNVTSANFVKTEFSEVPPRIQSEFIAHW